MAWRPGGPAGLQAISLVESLTALAIGATLLTLLGVSYAQMSQVTIRLEAVSKIRKLGQAVLAYTSDHDQHLPGPLWPGQVMYYDPDREGRLVRELASYLRVDPRPEPYVVERLIPKACRLATRHVPAEDVRVYVMNSSINLEGEMLYPFGSLTSPLVPTTVRINRLLTLPPMERWMLSEADQKHPDVATAPWKSCTAPEPLHQNRRMIFAFDGSAGLSPAAR